MAESVLHFEKELDAVEEALRAADSEAERLALESRRAELFAGISAWDRVQLARHAQRPRMLDYTAVLLEDFIELHGDRMYGDDPAMVCGVGRFRGETILVAGQQKGTTTDEKVRRHFGMAHPEGYRKARRVFRLAERYKLPIVTFVDTPAAHPGIEAEQHGQGRAIAENLRALVGLQTSIYSVILSEGGSGGALGIAVGDWVAMFQHAVYMICPPERCAEILWRDVEKRELAASAMKVSAADLKEFGVIDEVLDEPGGGAHRNARGAAGALGESIARFLEAHHRGAWTVEARREKFRRMGLWAETSV